MKSLYLSLAFLLLSFAGRACSIQPETFCNNASNGPNNLFYAKVIDTFPNGTKLEVLAVFRGPETRDTVTVWNSYGFRCTDTTVGPVYTVIYANALGHIGDTVFIILQKIDSVINSWDVIGDYRMSNIYVNTYLLKVTDGIVFSVTGYIAGRRISFFESTYFNSCPLDTLLSHWLANGNCTYLTLSADEVTPLTQLWLYPNPTTDNITFVNLPANAEIEVLSVEGKCIGGLELKDERLDISILSTGSYLVKITTNGKTGYRRIAKL